MFKIGMGYSYASWLAFPHMNILWTKSTSGWLLGRQSKQEQLSHSSFRAISPLFCTKRHLLEKHITSKLLCSVCEAQTLSFFGWVMLATNKKKGMAYCLLMGNWFGILDVNDVQNHNEYQVVLMVEPHLQEVHVPCPGFVWFVHCSYPQRRP